jgi:hypothetical protein
MLTSMYNILKQIYHIQNTKTWVKFNPKFPKEIQHTCNSLSFKKSLCKTYICPSSALIYGFIHPAHITLLDRATLAVICELHRWVRSQSCRPNSLHLSRNWLTNKYLPTTLYQTRPFPFELKTAFKDHTNQSATSIFGDTETKICKNVHDRYVCLSVCPCIQIKQLQNSWKNFH